MNFHRIYKNDMVNGEGIRTTLFVSGCEHACRGCYNKSTWSPDSGQPFTYEHMADILESLEPDHVSGLSLSGGDPLHPANVHTIWMLIYHVRKKFGKTKDIWLWTGYTKDEVMALPGGHGVEARNILREVDVLIDGKFVEELHDPELAFRGSSNQVIYRTKDL